MSLALAGVLPIPVADDLVETTETITLTLFDTGSYDVGSPATVPLSIIATWPTKPLLTWRRLYFNTTANTGLTADRADYDGDGVANLIEYALGSDPTVATPAQGTDRLPVATVANASSPLLSDRLALTVTLPSPPLSDLTYTIHASSDLSTWTQVATYNNRGRWRWLGGGTNRIIDIPSIATQSTVIVGDLVPTEGNPVRAMRLHVTTPYGL